MEELEESASRRVLLDLPLAPVRGPVARKRGQWAVIVVSAALLGSLVALYHRVGHGLGVKQASISLLSVKDRLALKTAALAAVEGGDAKGIKGGKANGIKGGQPRGIQSGKPAGIKGNSKRKDKKGEPKSKRKPCPVKNKRQGGWSIVNLLKNGLDWDGCEGVPGGHNVIMVPPPLIVPKSPLTLTLNGNGGRKKDAKETQKVLIPLKALEALEEMNRRNSRDLSQLTRAMGALKQEDKRTVHRVGEQLGALKSQIQDTIKGNVMLRKAVWLVHKLPGFPGHPGIPGVDGRPGRSSVIGPGGYSGPAGPPGANGRNGPSGIPGGQGEIGIQGFRGPPGPRGPTGYQGWRGEKGPVGGAGPMGRPGSRGEQGMPGRQGPHGVQGPPGLNGAWEVVKRIGLKQLGASRHSLPAPQTDNWKTTVPVTAIPVDSPQGDTKHKRRAPQSDTWRQHDNEQATGSPRYSENEEKGAGGHFSSGDRRQYDTPGARNPHSGSTWPQPSGSRWGYSYTPYGSSSSGKGNTEHLGNEGAWGATTPVMNPGNGAADSHVNPVHSVVDPAPPHWYECPPGSVNCNYYEPQSDTNTGVGISRGGGGVLPPTRLDS